MSSREVSLTRSTFVEEKKKIILRGSPIQDNEEMLGEGMYYSVIYNIYNTYFYFAENTENAQFLSETKVQHKIFFETFLKHLSMGNLSPQLAVHMHHDNFYAGIRIRPPKLGNGRARLFLCSLLVACCL